jgi:predicted DsbA family dithiol-disulfide isomerase
MQVEIWSDLICPWCYIGKRNFETAVAHAGLESTFEVVWRSFELDPQAAKEDSRSLVERLAQKYRVSMAEAAEMNARVTAVAAQVGLHYRLDIARPGNTFDAHRLTHLAAERGLGKQVMERLMQGYFGEGLAIGDHSALTQGAVECGMDADEVRALLAGDAYAAAVRADEERAAGFNIRGVPCFVFDASDMVSGAQPVETFLNAFRQLAGEHN